MIENTPRCRPCGNMLKSEASCTFCSEVKQVLVWPVLTGENELSASVVITDALRTVKSRLARLNKEIKAEGTSYDKALTKDLVALSKVLKELGAEQRKLEDREEDHYQKLGIEGRMKLVISEFFEMLPEDFQAKFLTSMQSAYTKQNTPKQLNE